MLKNETSWAGTPKECILGLAEKGFFSIGMLHSPKNYQEHFAYMRLQPYQSHSLYLDILHDFFSNKNNLVCWFYLDSTWPLQDDRENQRLWYGGYWKCQNAKLPKMPKCQNAKMPKCQNAKMPNCQNAKMPKCQIAKMPKCQNGLILN